MRSFPFPASPSLSRSSTASPSFEERPTLLRLSSYTSAASSDGDEPDTPILPRHRPHEPAKSHPALRPSSSSSSSGSLPFASALLRKARRAARTDALAWSVAVLAFGAVVLGCASILGWAARVAYDQHNGYAQAVFARPMVPEPQPVEGAVAPFEAWMAANATAGGGEKGAEAAAWDVERTGAIQAELHERLEALGLSPSTALPCADIEQDPDLSSRYHPLRGVGTSTSHARAGPTLFALNLYNSEAVLPVLTRSLLSLASFLGPETVHISIFENGSTDRTVAALAHLAAALTALGAPHTIVSDPRRTEWNKVDRIAQLALYRNVALAPLAEARYSANSSNPPEDIVFINDVFLCPRDVLELLFQRRVQKADAACAMDWRSDRGLAAMRPRPSIKFYDNWVSRSLAGHMFRFKLDVFSEWRDGINELFDQEGDEFSRARFRAGLPVPVYSCWNGMLALSAHPFLTDSVSPRYGGPNLFANSTAHASAELDSTIWQRSKPLKPLDGPTRFRSALKSEGECVASECKTLSRDLWTRGFDRWMIVPTVRVTYDLPTYLHPQLVSLSSLDPPSSSSLSLSSLPHASSPSSSSDPSPPAPEDLPLTELIPWSALSPPASVICFAWARGWHIDLQWWRASWGSPFEGMRWAKEWPVERARRRH
ncbi:hypothetical protein JCM10213_004672 [Rhodosporidiobolus nylandii]